jgi:glutathione S-transferase
MSLTSRPPHPIRLFRLSISGHCHRVQLLLSMLDLPYETVEVDLLAGEQKRPEYLAMNAFGQVPVIEDGALTLPDSNAILVYLATRYDPTGTWYPREPEAMARVQRWLSVAAGPLAFGPAAARAARLFRRQVDVTPMHELASRLFRVLDGHLGETPFVAGTGPTIADLALYSYTAHADEGGISLEPYPRVRTWLSRIEALPGFVPMPRARAASAPA